MRGEERGEEKGGKGRKVDTPKFLPGWSPMVPATFVSNPYLPNV